MIFKSVSSEIFFRLLSNSFFPFLVGLSTAFLTSYSLKTNYEALATSIDNFDIVMMVMAPVISFLVSESLYISGLISLISCGFVLSLYA